MYGVWQWQSATVQSATVLHPRQRANSGPGALSDKHLAVLSSDASLLCFLSRCRSAGSLPQLDPSPARESVAAVRRARVLLLT
jgi:hypothetical protein